MRKNIEARVESLEEGDNTERMLLLLVEGDAPTAEQQAAAEAAQRAAKPALFLNRQDVDL